MEKELFVWIDGKFFPWKKAKIPIMTHSLHYGDSVFEGIRFYETSEGPAIFRLEDHIKRLINSLSAFETQSTYSLKEISEAVKESIKKNKLPSGYIRPIFYFGEKIGLINKGLDVHLAILVMPFPSYLGEDPIKLKTSSYIRVHPKSSIMTAKIGGHYANSILASTEVKNKGYDEALLLDYKGNIAEGPGENIFIVKENKLLTPSEGSILPGITRDSVIKLAKEKNIEVIEKQITLEEVHEADEIFLTGTAAEITPVESIDDIKISDGNIGKITKELKQTFDEIVTGEKDSHLRWLSFIE